MLTTYRCSNQVMKNQFMKKNKKRNSKNPKSRDLPYALYNDPRPTFNRPIELKMVETIYNTTLTTAGVVIPISFPQQGVLSTERVGDRCRLQRLEIFGNFLASLTAVGRMIVFQQRGLNGPGTPPTVGDILNNVGTQLASATYVYNARQTFEIMCDKHLPLSTQGDSILRIIAKSCMPIISETRFESGTQNVYNGYMYVLFIASANMAVIPTLTFRLWYDDSN